jgi:hypothetical protein
MVCDRILGYSLVPLNIKGVDQYVIVMENWEYNILSAMAVTSRLTGTARLKSILEDMACWRIKLLQ